MIDAKQPSLDYRYMLVIALTVVEVTVDIYSSVHTCIWMSHTNICQLADMSTGRRLQFFSLHSPYPALYTWLPCIPSHNCHIIYSPVISALRPSPLDCSASVSSEQLQTINVKHTYPRKLLCLHAGDGS